MQELCGKSQSQHQFTNIIVFLLITKMILFVCENPVGSKNIEKDRNSWL